MGNPSTPSLRRDPYAPPPEPVTTRESMAAQHIAWLRRQEDAHVIIVAGGRAYFDRERVFAALDRAHAKKPITLLVHGGAAGADELAGEWAEARNVSVQVFEADWRTLGPKAGPARNQRMVDAGAHGAVAFPGGTGTADCCRRCEAAGIKVWRPFG